MSDETLPSTEDVYGKSDSELIAEGKARWKAQKAAANPDKEPWELVAFKVDPAVAAAFSEPTKSADKKPSITPSTR